MNFRVTAVSCLLFLSGVCALAFQVAWMREFRLVFGASTAASAAVLAIFMGGLGLGGAILGKRADKSPNPLFLYGNLLLLISVAAFASPFLVLLARMIYVGLGGQMVMGLAVASVVRMLLSALVLGVPTFLMGGTLPAAAAAVTDKADSERRHLAMLYGFNTLGAVAGAAITNFYLLEVFGGRNTLWLACMLGIVTAFAARSLARSFNEDDADSGVSVKTAGEEETVKESGAGNDGKLPPAFFVFLAAGVVGFAFFLMELVWYRMLGPLLGGSTYTFGLILVVALAGIGLGGWAYSVILRNLRASLSLFGFICALEALFMALPYALGDRLALLAAMLRELGAFGFYGDVLGWAAVASIVILPAAFISGIQFPLLIALLGRGRADVGKQVGYACAVNTIGAILGSMAGGFGLLPMLTAPGAWRLVVAILSVLSLLALIISPKRGKGMTVACLLIFFLIFDFIGATGPTAAWRHSPIGAGRVRMKERTINSLRNWTSSIRRSILWEAEGVETSAALSKMNGLAFILNGKVDGNAVYDAGTQVMLGLVGAALHPEPKLSMVVGLGTGESAGWLAEVKTMQRVDVVELEPKLDYVCELCSDINFDVLNHPKVNRIYNDAREVLLTVPEKYDLIVSEPSNPYRAGIAALFTQEFYASVRERLTGNGIFCQWLQGYEIDTQTVRTVLATLRSEFPEVQVWQTKSTDMLLLCSVKPLAIEADWLRENINAEPFKTALEKTWKTASLEGFLAHFAAGTPVADAVYKQERNFVNTDDRNRVEYGFARTVGRRKGFNVEQLRNSARERGCHRPAIVGEVDWPRVEDERILMYTAFGDAVPPPAGLEPEQYLRASAQKQYLLKDMRGAASFWGRQKREPESPMEITMMAAAYCTSGMKEQGQAVLKKLRSVEPAEADIYEAVLRANTGNPAGAVELLESVFADLGKNPWPHRNAVGTALALAVNISKIDTKIAERMRSALLKPFKLWVSEEMRVGALIEISRLLPPEKAEPIISAMEPHVPWNKEFLGYRYGVYLQTGNPLAERAGLELMEFVRNEAIKFDEFLNQKEELSKPQE